MVQRNHRERKKHILITGRPSEAKRDVHARERDVEEAHFELFSQLSWINVARNDSLVQYVRELEKRKREKEKRRFSCCTLRFFCVFIPQLRLISLLKIACFPMRRQHGRSVMLIGRIVHLICFSIIRRATDVWDNFTLFVCSLRYGRRRCLVCSLSSLKPKLSLNFLVILETFPLFCQ